MMTVRRAAPGDLASIQALQESNLLTRLAPEHQTDGFLSAAFSDTQLLHMAEDLGIDVVYEGSQLAGYLCAFRCDDLPHPPIVAAMLEAYPGTRFAGRPLDAAASYIYGPVCIARTHRGGTVLSRLYEAQRHRLAARFAIGAAFIADRNPRSLRAHTLKLGMRRAGIFQYKGALHHIVAFSTR